MPTSSRRARAPRRLLVLPLLLAAACSSGPAELSEADRALVDAADVALVGRDDLTWDLDVVEIAAGEIAVAVTCQRAVNHNLVIDGELVVECNPGRTVSGTVTLAPGEHEFVCTVPGHERRMRGTIVAS